MTDPTHALDAITEDALRSIVDQVWESLLHEPVDWADPVSVSKPGPSAGEETSGPVCTSQVRILGDWTAAVYLTVPAPAATQMTRTMLDLSAAEPVDAADVTDALGEMVNVVGGNVKALLATPARLGLPTTGTGPASATGRPQCRVLLRWRGAPIAVTVQELDLVTAPVT